MWLSILSCSLLCTILNLIVQKGLKVFGDALDQIRNNIKYVRG